MTLYALTLHNNGLKMKATAKRAPVLHLLSIVFYVFKLLNVKNGFSTDLLPVRSLINGDSELNENGQLVKTSLLVGFRLVFSDLT